MEKKEHNNTVMDNESTIGEQDLVKKVLWYDICKRGEKYFAYNRHEGELYKDNKDVIWFNSVEEAEETIKTLLRS